MDYYVRRILRYKILLCKELLHPFGLYWSNHHLITVEKVYRWTKSIRSPNNARRLIVDLLPKEVKLEPIIEKRLFVQFLRSAVSSCSKQLTDDKTSPPGKTSWNNSQTIIDERAPKDTGRHRRRKKGLESKFSSEENY